MLKTKLERAADLSAEWAKKCPFDEAAIVDASTSSPKASTSLFEPLARKWRAPSVPRLGFVGQRRGLRLRYVG